MTVPLKKGLIFTSVANDFSQIQSMALSHTKNPWWLMPPEHYNYFNIPTIKNFLTHNGITFKDISTLVIGCGPGSFTGIRVVVAAAKGIKISNDYMKVIGINSLAALAMSVLEEAREKNCRYRVC